MLSPLPIKMLSWNENPRFLRTGFEEAAGRVCGDWLGSVALRLGAGTKYIRFFQMGPDVDNGVDMLLMLISQRIAMLGRYRYGNFGETSPVILRDEERCSRRCTQVMNMYET